jgi:hypothetical protein
MLKELWRNEDGAIMSAEMVVVMTILGFGLGAGMTRLRDLVVRHLDNAETATVEPQRDFAQR